jgi:hypothetical protein
MRIEMTRPLERLKAEAEKRVDALAGQVRLKYISSSPGQDATYALKLKDAEAYIAAGYPAEATDYKWIAAEAAHTQMTPAQVADRIIASANLWVTIGAEIEGARQAAKVAIKAAATASDIRTAEQLFKAVVLEL